MLKNIRGLNWSWKCFLSALDGLLSNHPLVCFRFVHLLQFILSGMFLLFQSFCCCTIFTWCLTLIVVVFWSLFALYCLFLRCVDVVPSFMFIMSKSAFDFVHILPRHVGFFVSV